MGGVKGSARTRTGEGRGEERIEQVGLITKKHLKHLSLCGFVPDSSSSFQT